MYDWYYCQTPGNVLFFSARKINIKYQKILEPAEQYVFQVKTCRKGSVQVRIIMEKYFRGIPDRFCIHAGDLTIKFGKGAGIFLKNSER